MPVSLVANIVWRDVSVHNHQVGQLVHRSSNVKGDPGNLLHRQACFKQRNNWRHQHSVPESVAVAEVPSCQEMHKVRGVWRQQLQDSGLHRGKQRADELSMPGPVHDANTFISTALHWYWLPTVT